MPIVTGTRLPDSIFMTMTADGPEGRSMQDVFEGKRVALFGVPGAFTPTCSARHLPGFRDQAATLHELGVDVIACVAVNDIFVLDAWRKAQEVDGEVVMLADGNADFIRAVGMDMDGAAYGMGIRAQRFSMLVDDGTVEILNVEEGGAFEVSSADYLLDQLRRA